MPDLADDNEEWQPGKLAIKLAAILSFEYPDCSNDLIAVVAKWAVKRGVPSHLAYQTAMQWFRSERNDMLADALREFQKEGRNLDGRVQQDDASPPS